MAAGADAAPETVADTVVRSYDRVLATAAGRAAEIEPGLRISTARGSGPPAESLCQAAEQAAMLMSAAEVAARSLRWPRGARLAMVLA
jgi:hypothetical protein